MTRVLLLFFVVPAVELVLLIEIGQRIGTLPTPGLIVVTGALGAYLARRQGLGVLRRMRQKTAAGPAAPVMDGIVILIAGAPLITPGILADASGFFLSDPAKPGTAQAVPQAGLGEAIHWAMWRSASQASRRSCLLTNTSGVRERPVACCVPTCQNGGPRETETAMVGVGANRRSRSVAVESALTPSVGRVGRGGE